MGEILDRRGMWGLLERQAETRPDKLGVIIDQQPLSFAEVATRAEKIAGVLHGLGVRRGDRVGLLMTTSHAWMAAFWAIQCLGAVAVPLPPGTGRDEIVNIFRLTGVKVCFAVARYQSTAFEPLFEALRAELPSLVHVVVDGASSPGDFVVDFRAALEGASAWTDEMAPTVAPDDLYALMSTSGTTGVPKIVPKRHGPSAAYLNAYLEDYDIQGNDVLFSAMPPFHMLSLSYMMMCVMRGATQAYLSFFDPEEMLQTLRANRTNRVLLSATNAKMLLLAPGFEEADLSFVDAFLFSGELLPGEVAAEFCEKRPFRVMNIIGSTEVSAYLVWDSRRDRGVPVSVLTPLACVEMKLMNPDGEPCAVGERAEIFVSHGDILSEYYRNPEASALAIVTSTTGKRWFRTGDLAIPRPDGRYQFAGRLKRVIKRGATLIYPEEIECFLMTHPDIQAAAILKEEDDLKGESMKAFVEVRAGASLSVIDIVRFCQGRLSNHQIPDKIVLLDELPRETGKVQLGKLRDA
jgi:acyl-CoA synthetase (AMP-forming)/AMP-acid ligase II